jgi:hypothetical protein
MPIFTAIATVIAGSFFGGSVFAAGVVTPALEPVDIEDESNDCA